MLVDTSPEENEFKHLAHTRNLLPEIVIAIARPQGTNDGPVIQSLVDDLTLRRYQIERIRLSTYIRKTSIAISKKDGAEYQERKGHARIIDLMAQGDQFRAELGPSVVAEFAVLEIQRRRSDVQDAAHEARAAGIAYLLSSIVHHSEVALLRSVYKQRFFLLGIHQPYKERHEQLEEQFKGQGSALPGNDAREILDIDAGLRGSRGTISKDSLNIDSTFHRADVFVAAERPGLIEEDNRPVRYQREIQRWLDQMFGNPFGAPSFDEYGMANAYLAARQSVALGRSVGAAIVAPNGSLIAHGWNEPAHPGGGVGREGLSPDLREHHDKIDSSDKFRVESITEFLSTLIDPRTDMELITLRQLAGVDTQWLEDFRNATKDVSLPGLDDVKLLAAIRSLSTTRLLNLIEFGRSVHAEMAAITSAARSGFSTQGATLYVTTFPCHECSRNVVAAGIGRLVYIEPYGKSMARQLYSRSINVTSMEDGRTDGGRVVFEQFSGLAPSVHPLLFSTLVRKHSLATVATTPGLSIGEVISWARTSTVLRPSVRGYGDDAASDPYFEFAKVYAEASVSSRLRERIRALYGNKGQPDQLWKEDGDDDGK